MEFLKIVKDKKNHKDFRYKNSSYSFLYKREGESVYVKYTIVEDHNRIQVSFGDTLNVFRLDNYQMAEICNFL